MKLTKNVEISMNALKVLKSKEGFVRVQDMASEVGTTVHFLEQIMRKLKNAGLVDVKRGPGGGYAFKRDLGEVNAFQVASAFGKFSLSLNADDTSPANRLKLSVAEAFRNTTV
jgi:Rrf2 family iron-sulfur cluster assembly transcriptional regulator